MDLETIARHFLVFDQWLGAEQYGNGNINDTYRIRFERSGVAGNYLLQRLNHQVFKQPEAVMENIRKVAEYLSGQPYPYRIAAPLQGADGRLLYTDDLGNYWRVFPFFENTYSPEGLSDPETARKAARAYGAFARALHQYPAENLAETIPGFHDTDMRLAVFLQTLEADPAGRASAVQSEIEAVLAARPLFDKISRMKKNGALPVRVTHNDTKAGNVLFDRETGQAVAVIDWDTVMPGTILSDFGDMVRTFTPDCYEDAPAETLLLRTEILRVLQEGFLEETESFITPSERDNLLLGGQWIIAEQALRFLGDYLAGDTYYKIRYPDHNLVRARNQIALLQALSAGFISQS
jgi:aminoglycoside phosphotransferase (APT) family kinase protein